MSIPGSVSPLFLGAAGGYEISRSVRFNSSDSAFLSRTPASAGNRKTFTFAAWVKLGSVATSNFVLFNAQNGTSTGFSNNLWLYLTSNQLYVGDGVSDYLSSNNKFRDPSAWYHIVWAVDTTQATAANRMKLYVNGTELTYATDARSSITQGSDTTVNSTNIHYIGRAGLNLGYFDGYFADCFLIDGQALTPSSFTEVSATTGQLIPKAYTGTFGTNGFWLKFSDNSNNTAATLGKDYSPNGNNWTPNNLSVTAGAGNDSLVDTPTSSGTDTGAGGEVRGNYCTWNPLDTASATLTNGNLDISTPSSGFGATRGTFGVSSGKWYFEQAITSGATAVGVLRTSDSLSTIVGGTSGGYSYYSEGPGYTKKINNNVQTDYGASFIAGDIIGVALDLDAGTITFYKNGSSQGQAFSGLIGTFAPAISDGTNVGSIVGSVNFGQRPFAYTAPSGFKALCDTNLPAPVVAKPNTVMDVALWTGTGSSRNIAGFGFSPDFVWIKARGLSRDHKLFDTIRGTTKFLNTNLTNSEGTDVASLTAFNSDGFTLGADSDCNANTHAYVGWTWDAGSSTVTNPDGSITSQVRANASAGFSIVTYNHGSGVGASTIGHGLGVAPSLILSKFRDGTTNWDVYVRALGPGGRLILNSTAAFSSEVEPWNNTNPTSTVFSVGPSSWKGVGNHVAYCFAPVAGYSSFGSYSGTGSDVFVYTGFLPRWVMIKYSSGSESGITGWGIWDAARGPYNVNDPYLQANLSDAEDTSSFRKMDFVSNGFVLKGAGVSVSGNTYIYAAFAEHPFQFSRAR